jgi:enoyl-CoA hydratase/carnithine racemase
MKRGFGKIKFQAGRGKENSAGTSKRKVKAMALVSFERKEDTLRVSLNRTSALNAINSALLRELEQGLKEHEFEPAVKALVLFGQGGCFASGADIRELASLDEEGVRKFHQLRERTFDLLEKYPCPTLALIEKYALGTGLELALCCDFRIAAQDARLGVPSAKLGLVESYEYFARLVRAVGSSWGKKLVFTGDPVDAQTAFQIGLVEELSPPEGIFERADAILSRVLKNSASSIQQTKRVIADCAHDPNLFLVKDPALPMVDSTKSQDFKGATRAFLDRRKRD